MNSPHSTPEASKAAQTAENRLRTGYQSLGDRLTRLIIRWACVCTIATALIHGFLSWRETREGFEHAVTDLADSHAPLIASLIVGADDAALREEMQRLSDRPEIGFARLRVANGATFQSGAQALANKPVSRVIPLKKPGEPTRVLAQLEVIANPKVLYRELLHNVGTSALGYVVLTLLVSLLVRRIVDTELHQPLRELAKSVDALSSEKLSLPIKLQGRPRNPRDEIDRVVDGFGVLQQSLNSHITELDQKVAERTARLESALASIREMAIRDPLTGCHNRQHFNERIVQEVQRVARYGHALSILFADIDRFKQINDSRGHLFGDEVLRVFVSTIGDRIREGVDWVARYGGEEFVVVMPETSLEGARATAEKLREAVEQIVVRGSDDEPVGITASFGVAQLQPGETVISLIDRADRNLYEAKVAGRNRVGGLSDP